MDKMNEIVSMCTRLYKVIRDLAEYSKSYYYTWEWVKKPDGLKIKNRLIEIKIHKRVLH